MLFCLGDNIGDNAKNGNNDTYEYYSHRPYAYTKLGFRSFINVQIVPSLLLHPIHFFEWLFPLLVCAHLDVRPYIHAVLSSRRPERTCVSVCSSVMHSWSSSRPSARDLYYRASGGVISRQKDTKGRRREIRRERKSGSVCVCCGVSGGKIMAVVKKEEK